MAKINVRSPYFVNVATTNLTSAKIEIEIYRHIEYLHAFDTFGLHLYSNTIFVYVHYLEKEILLILGLAGPVWRGLAFLIVGNLCFFGCPCERDVG